MKKLTVKYEYSVRSDTLYKEIIKACDDAHDTLFALTKNVIIQLQTSKYNLVKIFIFFSQFEFNNYQSCTATTEIILLMATLSFIVVVNINNS